MKQIKSIVMISLFLIQTALLSFSNEDIFPNIKNSQEVMIIKDKVQVFDSAKTSVIATLNKKDIVTFAGKDAALATYKNIKNRWWKIVMKDKKEGYVFGEFIAPYFAAINKKTVTVSETWLDYKTYGGTRIDISTLKLTLMDNEEVLFVYFYEVLKDTNLEYMVTVSTVNGVTKTDFDKNGTEELCINCNMGSKQDLIQLDGYPAVTADSANIYFTENNSRLLNVFVQYANYEKISRWGKHLKNYTYKFEKNKIVAKVKYEQTLYGMDINENETETKENSEYEENYNLNGVSYFASPGVYPFENMYASRSVFVTPTVPTLRFRENSSADAKVLGSLQKGQKLMLISTKGQHEFINDSTGKWISVETDKGEIGWCFDGFIEEFKK